MNREPVLTLNELHFYITEIFFHVPWLHVQSKVYYEQCPIDIIDRNRLCHHLVELIDLVTNVDRS